MTRSHRLERLGFLLASSPWLLVAHAGCVGSSPHEGEPCTTMACGESTGGAEDGPEPGSTSGMPGSSSATTQPGSDSGPPHPATSAEDDGPAPSDDSESTAGDEAPDPSGEPPMCSDLGGTCEYQEDCCGWSEGSAVCVGNIDGDGASCLSTCASDDACSSTCCADLQDGGGACADASWCQAACAPLFTACTSDDDCCGDSFCDDTGWCTTSCVEHADCPNDCCSNGGWCIGLQDCQGAIVCTEGEFFCGDPAGMFVCQGNAWYPVDCNAGCIDAGFAGASGCGYAADYGDDACFCFGDDEPEPDPDPSGGGCDPEACNDSQIICDEYGCLACFYWCEGDSCTQHCDF